MIGTLLWTTTGNALSMRRTPKHLRQKLHKYSLSFQTAATADYSHPKQKSLRVVASMRVFAKWILLRDGSDGFFRMSFQVKSPTAPAFAQETFSWPSMEKGRIRPRVPHSR